MFGGLKTVGCCYVVGIGLAITGCSGGGAGSVSTPGSTTASATRSTGASSVKSILAATTTVLTEMPRPSDGFVDSVGINTHFNYPDTPYVSNYAAVMGLLTNLGVRHIRDSYSSGKPYFQTALTTAASNGIHTLLTTQINDPVSEITAFVATVPNAIEAIEAPNEPDLNLGPNWASEVKAYQPILYSGIKGSSITAQLPVYGPSLTSPSADQAVGNMSAYMDVGNIHEYMGPWYPFDWNWMPGFISAVQTVSGTKPIAMTETGYEDPNTVTAAIKARYTLRTSLEAWNGNLLRTYFYELEDEGGQYFGLVDSTSKPKPAYLALQNLLHMLSDPGPAFAMKPLTYSITADPSVHHTLLQKRDGSIRLVLWISTQATDPIVPTQTVTINSAVRFGKINQYTWQDSGQYTTQPLVQAVDGTVTLTVTDRVTVLGPG